MGWLGKMLAAGVGAFVLAMLESARECNCFKVTHYTMRFPKNCQKNQNIKKEHCVIFLSDLHNHVYGKDNQILLERIRKETPGLILLGGDMLIGKKGVSPQPSLELIRQLPGIAPVYYAYGNHEQRMLERRWKYKNVMESYEEELQKAGVKFLKNRSEQVKLGETRLRISGLMLPMDSYEKFCHRKITGDDLESRLGSADSECLQILLAHNPAYVSAYKSWGADLILCGHLHGGVMRIPGWRGVITPQAFLFPRYSGEMSVEEDAVVVVSKGLGTHTVNLRLFNVPEIVALHF